MQTRDRRFAKYQSDIESFQFDESVSAVFADMIRRSVPGYSTVIAMTGVLAGEYANPGTDIYDLGCSLGTSLFACSQYAPQDCTLIGVDNAQPMLDRCEKILSSTTHAKELRLENIQDSVVENASLVIMNYTLQFIPPQQRARLLSNVYQGLNPGGALLLSEKMCFENAIDEQHITDLYYAFKRENGYSELEISQKRTALENVLIPDTENQHIERLQDAGFTQINSWFQCLNFKSILAVKH